MNLAMQLGLLMGVILLVNGKGNAPESADWESFKAFHGKYYANSESEIVHKKNFEMNAKAVSKHNKAFEGEKVSYEKELNSFADMDPKTFAATYCGYKVSNETVVEPALIDEDFHVGQLSSSFDWRDSRKVTPVKNQGRCGSCWAFAAVAAIESQVLIANRASQPLSEEQLVDCDKRSSGCNGGRADNAFRYIQSVGGITTEQKYPYKAGNGRSGSCTFDANSAVVKVAGQNRVSNSADALMQALVSRGPLAVAFESKDMQFYSGGVYSCKSQKMDHAVILVGYGTENGKDYWLIKNSWGTRWGEQGYGKVSRNPNEDCGMTRDVQYVQIQ